MLNTYINENMDVPYPFYGTESLPFPNSCILGMQIALYDWTLGDAALYAASVTLSKDSAYVLICESSGNKPVLALSAVKQGTGGTSTLIQNVCAGTVTKVNAFMELGSIPESAYGLYTGKFYIDPSCVSVIPESAVNLNQGDSLRVNTLSTVSAGQCLEIRASGLFTISKGTKAPQGGGPVVTDFTIGLSPDVDLDSLELYAVLDNQNYTRVESVNGISTNSPYEEGGSILIFTTPQDQDLPSVTVSGEQIGNVLHVRYKGNTEFRSCYDPDEDEAGDVTQ